MIGLRGTGRLWRATAGTRSTVVVDEWFGLKAAVELDVPALLATSRLPRNKSCSFASCLARASRKLPGTDLPNRGEPLEVKQFEKAPKFVQTAL